MCGDRPIIFSRRGMIPTQASFMTGVEKGGPTAFSRKSRTVYSPNDGPIV